MALTLFEDFVYWTDGKSKSLRRAHKTTGSQGMELLNSWQAIKSIKVYHSLRQPEGMLDICLPRPISSHVLSLIWLSYYILQFLNISARLPMEDAATSVSCLLAVDTNVPVPLISTWLQTIRPACPTAPPVRSGSQHLWVSFDLVATFQFTFEANWSWTWESNVHTEPKSCVSFCIGRRC